MALSWKKAINKCPQWQHPFSHCLVSMSGSATICFLPVPRRDTFSLEVLQRLYVVWIRVLHLHHVDAHQVLFLKDVGDNSLLSGWKEKRRKGAKWSCLFSYSSVTGGMFLFSFRFVSFLSPQQLLSQMCISKFTQQALSASLCKTFLAWRWSQLSCMYLSSSRSLPGSYLYFMSLHTPWGSALPAVKGSSATKATMTQAKCTDRWSSLDLPPQQPGLYPL